MRRVVVGVGLAAVALAFVFTGGCVGDEPSGSSASPDASTPEGGIVNPTTPTGAEVTCQDPFVKCGDACVDLATSAENCGECGRSCGGGKCDGKTCGKALLWEGISNPAAFAIDAAGLYVTHDTLVESCPLAGCAATTPKQIANTGKGTGGIGASNGRVYFVSAPQGSTNHPALYTCPTDGCPSTLPVVAGSGFTAPDPVVLEGDTVFYRRQDIGIRQITCPNGACGEAVAILAWGSAHPEGLAVDAANVYFVDTDTTSLAKCPKGAATCTPTSLTTWSVPSYFPATPVVQHGGILYLVGVGFTSGSSSIRICPTAGCDSPQEFTKTVNQIQMIAVDDTTVYWSEDNENSGAGWTLNSCPAAGCSGGPKVRANADAIRGIAIDDKFLYWLEVQTPDGGTPVGSIYRILK